MGRTGFGWLRMGSSGVWSNENFEAFTAVISHVEIF
jgi:hypothetical protein